jgi:hypothetical protein
MERFICDKWKPSYQSYTAEIKKLLAIIFR